jgi:hypothetical protein
VGHPVPHGCLKDGHDLKGWYVPRKTWRAEQDIVFSCWYPKKEEEASCRVTPKIQSPNLSRMSAHHTIKRIKEVTGKVRENIRGQPWNIINSKSSILEGDLIRVRPLPSLESRVLDVMGREAP